MQLASIRSTTRPSASDAVVVDPARGAALAADLLTDFTAPYRLVIGRYCRVISSGTPGAVPVQPGDVAECRIPGVGALTNPVTGATRHDRGPLQAVAR